MSGQDWACKFVTFRLVSVISRNEKQKPQPHLGVEPQETPNFYFKIPYVGHFSGTAQRSIRKLANQLCKPIDIRLVFTTFKIKNLCNAKDAVPKGLRTRVVFKYFIIFTSLVVTAWTVLKLCNLLARGGGGLGWCQKPPGLTTFLTVFVKLLKLTTACRNCETIFKNGGLLNITQSYNCKTTTAIDFSHVK